MNRVLAAILFLLGILMLAAQPVRSQESSATAYTLPAATLSEPVWQETVNVEMKDVQLDTALGTLLKGVDISYMVDRDVAALKVTAVLKNVTRETAFREILKASGVVANVSPDGIWRISSEGAWYLWGKSADLQLKLSELKQKLQSGPVKPPDDKDVLALTAAIAELERKLAEENKRAGETIRLTPRTDPEVEQSQPSRTQILVINYVNPAELVPMLYAIGARQVTVTGENRLVISGTDEALKKAGDVIAGVDREDSLPRPVRLKLTVNVRSEQKGGEPFDCSISCDGAGAEGQMIQPNLSVKLPVGKTGDTAEVFLNSTITPTITPDGKIALRGAGSFKCTPSGEVSRTFDVAAVVQPGKFQVISEGSADVGTGKVSFSVDVVATIGEGRLRKPAGGGIFHVPGVGSFGAFGEPMGEIAKQFHGIFGNDMGKFGEAMKDYASKMQENFKGFGEGMPFSFEGCPPGGKVIPERSDREECEPGSGSI